MKRTIIFLALLIGCHIVAFAQTSIYDDLVNIYTLINDKQYSEAERALKKVEKTCTETNDDTIRAYFLCRKGQLLFFQEHYAECIQPLLDAYNILEEINLGDEEVLECLFFISLSYKNQSDYPQAERYLRKAFIKCLTANVGDKSYYKRAFYVQLIDIYEAQGDTIMQNLCQEEFDAHLAYLNWKTETWGELDKYRKARDFKKSTQLLSDMSNHIYQNEGKNDDYILARYSEAIDLYYGMSDFRSAIPILSEIIQWGLLLPYSVENVCGAFCLYCCCLAISGDIERLNTIVPQAISYLSTANSSNYPPNEINRYIGNGAFIAQEDTVAIRCFEMYLADGAQRKHGPYVAQVTNHLSVAYLRSDMASMAEQLLDNFLSTQEDLVRDDSPQILADIYHNLGRASMINGNKDKAIRYFTKSKQLQIELFGTVYEKTQQYLNECVD